jgi:hypothetical protein
VASGQWSVCGAVLKITVPDFKHLPKRVSHDCPVSRLPPKTRFVSKLAAAVHRSSAVFCWTRYSELSRPSRGTRNMTAQ